MPAIVFVHLGTPFPEYLSKNLERTRRLFPERELVLIHSGQAGVEKYLRVAKLFEYNSADLSTLSLEVPQLDLDMGFWGGYWQHTFERLFALGAYQAANKGPFLHVESDVVLFPSFPFGAFEQVAFPAWPAVSETMDVASVVYSPNFQSYLEVLVGLRNIAMLQPKSTDMSALSRFAKTNPDRFFRLPSHPSHKLKSGDIENSVPRSSPNFHGFFDGLTLGHWFAGRDPRNSWGIRVRYLNPLDSPLDFTNQSFFVDAYGNLYSKFTTVSGRAAEEEFSIHCLHVHSKNLRYFEADNVAFLKMEVAKVNARVDSRHFFLLPFLVHARTHARALLRASVSARSWMQLAKRLTS